MNIDGKMQPTSGNSILIGALAAISSARWRRSMRSCSDWTWSTLLIGHAELLGLDDRADEVGQCRHVGAADDVAQRVAAGLADADLGQCAPELVGQRALRLLDDLGQRGVEAEAGATEIVSRSSVSGTASRIAFWRFLMRRLSQNSGAKKPIRPPSGDADQEAEGEVAQRRRRRQHDDARRRRRRRRP